MSALSFLWSRCDRTQRTHFRGSRMAEDDRQRIVKRANAGARRRAGVGRGSAGSRHYLPISKRMPKGA
jgi:hypothetical protein